MKTSFLVRRYVKKNLTEVMHTTFNPKGPGVVRIHLIPPKYDGGQVGASVAIINGQDIIPVNVAWAIILNEYIKQVNKYSGKPINEKEIEIILKNTCKSAKKAYPFISRKRMKHDLAVMLEVFEKVARREKIEENIPYISLGDYASFMKAPHRMDLMISAMTQNEKWNCNQKCVHCYAAGQCNSKEKELTTRQWKSIIDKCRTVGIPQLTFTGGEPTMREELVELVEYAHWFVTRLNTNGLKMTKQLCKELYDASLDSVQFTLYSCDEEVHNKLVGTSGHMKTVEGIKNALEAGLNVSVNTPLCTLNRDYVNTLNFLHKLGVMYVTCSGLITTGNATTKDSEKLQLTKEEIKTILKEATEYCFRNDMEISFTTPGWVEDEYCVELGITTPSCGACLSNMAITPGGNVVPCQSWLSEEPLGNMIEDEWSMIWNNPRTAVRRDFSARMTGLCPLRKYREEGKV
ncbi:MAG: radical SAM protein [Lachnospiraceae bacterium]|nr:radical SAM protein [Lachnospiraceae bacterium]